MTERIARLKQFFVTDKAHHAKRRPPLDAYALAQTFEKESMDDTGRAAGRLLAMLAAETPVIFPYERIVFTRTNPTVQALFTPAELDAIRAGHTLHERGDVSNINVDYTRLLACGFAQKKEELARRGAAFAAQGKQAQAEYLALQAEILDGVQALCDSYRALAETQGRRDIADTLARVPAHPPRTLPEALQMFRILHFTMWLGGNYHNTVGRFDQYMYPYYRADVDAGRLKQEEALEWVEEFFLTFNRDSDLYPGMQQGDNGQSVVLGGLKPDGGDGYNELSALCLRASLELSLIDPKINLRVHSGTPLNVYVLGTELTRQGLGFPQYANDDVVIPALLAYGYDREDAYNYVAAACWEFIIPGRGMEIPNVNAVSFAAAAQRAVAESLSTAADFPALMDAVKADIRRQAMACAEAAKNIYIFPAPFLSLMMEGCVEQGRDISLGCRYNNYGLHGTGVATAVDALAAIRKYVYGEKTLSKQALLTALARNFEGDEALLALLRYDAPKMGNNDPEADDLAVALLDAFADSLAGLRNDRGGIFRGGTGSAMYYLWHAGDLPATADGRRAGENLAANYSPSLFARIRGPVSILQSFAKPHLGRVCNGGPLTLELHDTLFRNAEAIEKVAMMVRSFMQLGGQQLQLNAVNREKLLDAQQNPQAHRGLIVRVWGWSGYFVELDKEYQDHIISRMELAL
ncbi:MAG: pyruvate formate-lyase [Oscillospiraceae bacterium]|nr:pyruvate formate-lyase [Oscillospiraceae bacterium]